MSQTPFEWRNIQSGDAITRWAVSAPDRQYFPGTPRPMPDIAHYAFRNGWVDTGDLPCREALRAALPDRELSEPEGPFDQIHPGDDGDQVDFSQFCFVPTLIRRGLQCLVQCDTPGATRFRMTTAGGVHVWLNGTHVAAFEPFSRNQLADTEVTLDLPEGQSTLTVSLEDLHERDTTHAFGLTLLDGPPLRTALPHATPGLDALCDHLANVRMDGVFHEQGMAYLVADPPPELPLQLCVTGLIPFARGGLSVDPDRATTRLIELSAASPRVALFDVAQTDAGCLALNISAKLGRFSISRDIGTTNLPPAVKLTGTLADRKEQATEIIRTSGGFEPSRAALLAVSGAKPDTVSRILNAALDTIEARHDCSDFTILPLLRLWRDGRHTLASQDQARLRNAILGYRYWLTEPGDDVMWFWSENHVLCFHVAQRLAGLLFPTERFLNSGKLGTALASDALERLNVWFDAIFRDGLCEWNSAAYYPIDLLGLFSLHDLDPELRPRASALIDRIHVMTALHMSGGTPAGSQGRCYEKELLAGPCTELGSLAAVAFGGAFRPGYDRAAALLCLSDYAPPKICTRLATPKRQEVLEARYTQGIDHAGKLSLWKSIHGQISTVCELPAGTKGHQAQFLDVQMAGHPLARLWINIPGELKPWGDRRPSLLAGAHVTPQVAQSGPTALMICETDRPWTNVGFAQVFAPKAALDVHARIEGWTVFCDGLGHVAVWCSEDLTPTDGLYADSLWRAMAPRTGWVVTLRMPDESYETFCKRLRRMLPIFDRDRLVLHTKDHTGAELKLDFAGQLSIDQSGLPFSHLTPLPQISWNAGAFCEVEL